MKQLRRAAQLILLLCFSNIILLIAASPRLWLSLCAAILLPLAALAMSVLPCARKSFGFKLNILAGGYELLMLSLAALVINIPLQTLLLLQQPTSTAAVANCIFCAVALLLFIANGSIRIMATSSQLGTMRRAFFLMLWWVPVINLIFAASMCMVVRSELKFESERLAGLPEGGIGERCRTKYPILLVHGVFFMDMELVNYWGRIPGELRRNGADIYYGGQQSALSVEDSALEIKRRVLEIIERTGSDKVNIIAHSKGGIDCRYMISMLGMADYVATLTTINTPHRGCAYADYLLQRAPKWFRELVENSYNSTLTRLGERSPDFMSAVKSLTKSSCEQMNKIVLDAPGVYYQSVCSVMNNRRNAGFPLNLTYGFVKKFEGENDGLVSPDSARWGNFLGVISTPKNKKGVSHANMVDMLHYNNKYFDVREFYVRLVAKLNEIGY